MSTEVSPGIDPLAALDEALARDRARYLTIAENTPWVEFAERNGSGAL